MPTLSDVTIAAREAQVIQVMGLVYQGSSIKDACATVGIDERTYRRWATESSEYISAIRELLNEVEKERILELASARARIEELIILDGLNSDTEPADRLHILKWLAEELEISARSHQAQPGVEQEAQEFLRKGPTITRQRSRLAAINVTETDEGFQVDLYQDRETIDLGPEGLRDAPEHPEESPDEE